MARPWTGGGPRGRKRPTREGGRQGEAERCWSRCPQHGRTREVCGQGRCGRPVPGVRKPVRTEVAGGPRRPSSLRGPARWPTALPSQRGLRLQAAPSRPPAGLGIGGGTLHVVCGHPRWRHPRAHAAPGRPAIILALWYSPQKPLKRSGGAWGGVRNTGSGDHPAEGPVSATSLLCELGQAPHPL